MSQEAMFRINYFFLLILISSNLLWCQNLKNDLNQITHRIDSSKQISLEVKACVYGKKGGSMVYSTKASLYRNGDATLTRLAEQDYLVTPNVEVTVDNEEKEILILKKNNSKTVNKTKTKGSSLDLNAINDFLDQQESVKPIITLVSNVNGIKTYRVSNIPDLVEMKVILNMNELTINRIEYHYKESSSYKGQFVSLDYTKFSYNENNSSLLKTSNYYYENDGKVVCSAKYKNYSLFTEL